jgi:hypothetical protein
MKHVITILISLIIFYFIYNIIFSKVYIKSNLDNRYYLVKNTKESQKVADTLAIINRNIKILLNQIKSKPDLSKNIQLIQSRYRAESLTENIDLSSTTYTINKGAEISFCIVARDSKEMIYDINLLMFVTIHELAHVGCESIGHTVEFKKFFKFLLEQAIICRVYKYTDYRKNPENYCGMQITSTPI